MPAGRPTKYSKELGEEICKRIAMGSNIQRLQKMDDMPCGNTFFRWLRENEEFSQDYTRAVTERAHGRFDRIDDIVEEARQGKIDPQIAKLQIDTMKWQVGKEDRLRYGDSHNINATLTFNKMQVIKIDGKELDLIGADE